MPVSPLIVRPPKALSAMLESLFVTEVSCPEIPKSLGDTTDAAICIVNTSPAKTVAYPCANPPPPPPLTLAPPPPPHNCAKIVPLQGIV